MLLGRLLVDRSTRLSSITATNLLTMPDEVLQQIVLVLGKEQDLGLLDRGTDVRHEMLTLARQLVGRIGQEAMSEEAVEGHIDLLVLRRGKAKQSLVSDAGRHNSRGERASTTTGSHAPKELCRWRTLNTRHYASVVRATRRWS